MFPRNENRNEGTFGCSPGTKTGTRVCSDVPPERKPERAYVRQNHPFTKPPFYLPVKKVYRHLVVSNLVVCNFYAEAPFALFCAPFAFICVSLALICVSLHPTAFRTTAFGNCRADERLKDFWGCFDLGAKRTNEEEAHKQSFHGSVLGFRRGGGILSAIVSEIIAQLIPQSVFAVISRSGIIEAIPTPILAVIFNLVFIQSRSLQKTLPNAKIAELIPARILAVILR